MYFPLQFNYVLHLANFCKIFKIKLTPANRVKQYNNMLKDLMTHFHLIIIKHLSSAI